MQKKGHAEEALRACGRESQVKAAGVMPEIIPNSTSCKFFLILIEEKIKQGKASSNPVNSGQLSAPNSLVECL